MLLRALLGSFIVAGIGFSLVGCGGSGGGDSDPTTTPVNFSIAWAERSRAIQGPSSAQSATITMNDAGAHGEDFATTVNRNAAPAGYTQNYTSATSARAGNHTLTIRFYDAAGGQGNVVAEGTASVTITATGGGIGDIAVGKKITTVTVPAGQIAPRQVDTQLTFTARDAGNALVPVSPGSAMWTQVDGGDVMSLTQDGIAEGITQLAEGGVSHVRVTVDGVQSTSTAVMVPGVAQFQDGTFEASDVAHMTFKMNGDVNGSAWSGDANWGVGNATTIWGLAGHDSQKHAFIQADDTGEVHVQGKIRQTVNNLIVGKTYKVSFWVARRNGIWAGNEIGNVGALMTVLANGTQITEPTGPTNTGGWRQVFTQPFVATQSTYEFTFTTLHQQFPENGANLIDDIKLEVQD